MDPDHDPLRQGVSHDDNDDHRTANVHPCASSSAGSTARPVDGLLLSDRESWNFRQTALSDENSSSNDEADTELVELTVLCAHNLKNLRCLGRMDPRAELYIDRDFTVNTWINFDGGTNPYWNHRFWFKIDDACFQVGHLSIEIYDVWSSLEHGGNPLIGTACMPMSDLSGSNWVTKFFSYQVKVPWSGQFRGRVHVLVRRVRKAMVQLAYPFIDEPWKRYKAGWLAFPYSGMYT